MNRQLFQDNYHNKKSTNFKDYVNAALEIACVEWAWDFFGKTVNENGNPTYHINVDEMSLIVNGIARSCLNNKANAEYYTKDLEDYAIIGAYDGIWTCYDGMSDAIHHIWQKARKNKIYDNMYYDYYNDQKHPYDIPLIKAEEWIFPDDTNYNNK